MGYSDTNCAITILRSAPQANCDTPNQSSDKSPNKNILNLGLIYVWTKTKYYLRHKNKYYYYNSGNTILTTVGIFHSTNNKFLLTPKLYIWFKSQLDIEHVYWQLPLVTTYEWLSGYNNMITFNYQSLMQ